MCATELNCNVSACKKCCCSELQKCNGLLVLHLSRITIKLQLVQQDKKCIEIKLQARQGPSKCIAIIETQLNASTNNALST